MTPPARRRTVEVARVLAHVGRPPVCVGAVSGPSARRIAMGIETIVFVVVIVLIVLFVMGYIGRGRRA